MVRRAGVVVGVAVAGLAVGACTGSTEPATDVTSSSATLQARGTADNGRAYSFFEYGPSGVLAAARTTDGRSWPAGTSGPIRERVSPLYPETAYSFRICGNDEGKAAVCAQTRTFTTPRASADGVKGQWLFGYGGPHSVRGFVNATAGSGGTLSFRIQAGSTYYFEGTVTCVLASGRRAAVGAVGDYLEAGSGARRPATALLTVLDAAPGQPDRVLDTYQFGSTPPACATAPDPTASGETNGDGLVVYDAP